MIGDQLVHLCGESSWVSGVHLLVLAGGVHFLMLEVVSPLVANHSTCVIKLLGVRSSSDAGGSSPLAANHSSSVIKLLRGQNCFC